MCEHEKKEKYSKMLCKQVYSQHFFLFLLLNMFFKVCLVRAKLTAQLYSYSFLFLNMLVDKEEVAVYWSCKMSFNMKLLAIK